MSLGLTASESSSTTLVDSADPGSHDAASLFWTSMSLALSGMAMPRSTIQATRTIHFVMRPVSLPAICRCMAPTLSVAGDNVHR